MSQGISEQSSYQNSEDRPLTLCIETSKAIRSGIVGTHGTLIPHFPEPLVPGVASRQRKDALDLFEFPWSDQADRSDLLTPYTFAWVMEAFAAGVIGWIGGKVIGSIVESSGSTSIESMLNRQAEYIIENLRKIFEQTLLRERMRRTSAALRSIIDQMEYYQAQPEARRDQLPFITTQVSQLKFDLLSLSDGTSSSAAFFSNLMTLAVLELAHIQDRILVFGDGEKDIYARTVSKFIQLFDKQDGDLFACINEEFGAFSDNPNKIEAMRRAHELLRISYFSRKSWCRSISNDFYSKTVVAIRSKSGLYATADGGLGSTISMRDSFDNSVGSNQLFSVVDGVRFGDPGTRESRISHGFQENVYGVMAFFLRTASGLFVKRNGLNGVILVDPPSKILDFADPDFSWSVKKPGALGFARLDEPIFIQSSRKPDGEPYMFLSSSGGVGNLELQPSMGDAEQFIIV